MALLAIRFCSVSQEAEAAASALAALGLVNTLDGESDADRGFPGAVFPARDGSWVELWKDGPGMPAGTMLQLVVDDADAYAARARDAGLAPQGPFDAHGERMYHILLPGGLLASFQSSAETGPAQD